MFVEHGSRKESRKGRKDLTGKGRGIREGDGTRVTRNRRRRNSGEKGRGRRQTFGEGGSVNVPSPGQWVQVLEMMMDSVLVSFLSA